MKRFAVWFLALLLALPAASGADALSGEPVYFGHYEQDNNPDNGPEPIAWIPLAEEDGSVLLLSRYILDAVPYNEQYTDMTWEACSLRAWLNGAFLETAFSAEERQAILLTEVDNSPAQRSPKFKTVPGADTQDSVFVLSYAEAAACFGSDAARRCPPTDYAIARGALTNSGFRVEGRCSGLWWLRSPGNFQYRVSVVYSSGALNYTYVTKPSGGVRPALRLDAALLP